METHGAALVLVALAAHWLVGHAPLPQTLGLLAAVGLAGAVLVAWWLDAHDAIAVLRETVYPGGRATEAGGGIDRWCLLKGWLNPYTLHVDAPMVASEAAPFQFLWLPTLIVVAWPGWRARRIDAVALMLTGFALFALTFQFIGIPAAVNPCHTCTSNKAVKTAFIPYP